jgi:hypothetical protein
VLLDVIERPQAVTDAAYAIDAVVTGHRQAMDAIGGKFAERQAASTTAGSGRRPSRGRLSRRFRNSCALAGWAGAGRPD